MNSIKTEALEIAFEEGGPTNGIPVLLIHGWPDAPRGWKEVSRCLQAEGYRRLVLENVGHFPHREAPGLVAEAVVHHFQQSLKPHSLRS